MLSVIVEGDQLTTVNLLGFSLCLVGVSIFKYERWTRSNHMEDLQQDYDKLSDVMDDAFDITPRAPPQVIAVVELEETRTSWTQN